MPRRRDDRHCGGVEGSVGVGIVAEYVDDHRLTGGDAGIVIAGDRRIVLECVQLGADGCIAERKEKSVAGNADRGL